MSRDHVLMFLYIMFLRILSLRVVSLMADANASVSITFGPKCVDIRLPTHSVAAYLYLLLHTRLRILWRSLGVL